jgi:hypothetical protein
MIVYVEGVELQTVTDDTIGSGGLSLGGFAPGVEGTISRSRCIESGYQHRRRSRQVTPARRR